MSKGPKMKNLNERSVRILASLGLILTTMIWGFAFVVMKNSVDLIPPTYLLAIRFSMSAVLLALLFHKNLFAADRQTILCGAILGIFLCLSYQFQTYGLKYTTASKNAFITTLYVIIVPFLYWIVSKKRPTGRNIAAAFIAVIGLALLSLQGDLTINFGDFLTLVCGLMFAVHMVFIDKFTEHHDPIALTVIQILAAAIINWICAPFLDGSFDFAVLANQSLIVGLLYLLKFFFRLVLVRIIDICIRVILSAQRPVCFFDLIHAGVTRHPQDTVWIQHYFFSSFCFAIPSYFIQIPEYNIFLKMSTYSSIGRRSNCLEHSAASMVNICPAR